MGGNDTIITFSDDNLIYYHGGETIDAGSNGGFFTQRHGDTLKIASDALVSQVALGTEIKGIEYIDAMDVDHGLLIRGLNKTHVGGSAFGDAIYGGGSNTLYGNAGNDLIDGIGGNSSISGGSGSDTIYCRDGDTVRGGSGADVFVLAGDSGRIKIMDFVQGEDIINDNALISAGYVRKVDSNVVSYTYSYIDSHGEEAFKYYSVYASRGTAGGSLEVIQSESLGIDMQNSTDPYKIFGNNWGETLSASSGDCTLIGNGGDDYLLGGRGNDYLELDGPTSWEPTASGGDGQDTLVATKGLSGFFNLYGGDGDDLIKAETLTGPAYLYGDGGNDTICVDQIISGKTFLSGGTGDDLFKVGHIDTSSDAYARFNDYDSRYSISALGSDTYQLQASGYAATINESGKDADVIEFFGVGNVLSLSQLSDDLKFRKYVSGNTITLEISGILNGKTDSILNFTAQDFSGDKLNLYKDQSAGSLLFGGSIDISSIVSHVSDIDNSSWKKLSFAQSGTNIIAIGSRS